MRAIFKSWLLLAEWVDAMWYLCLEYFLGFFFLCIHQNLFRLMCKSIVYYMQGFFTLLINTFHDSLIPGRFCHLLLIHPQIRIDAGGNQSQGDG